MTEDEMVGRHHQLDGHEVEQAPGDGEGQGSLQSMRLRLSNSKAGEHHLAPEPGEF